MFIVELMKVKHNVTYLSVPPKFGKSTIIDMTRRFLSVELNGTIPVHYKKNSNYPIFCKKPLKVCKDKEFVAKHFGRYPVMMVDFSPLKDSRNFSHLLKNFATVIAKTFAQHSYLLDGNVVWPPKSEMTREDFNMYLNEEKPLDEFMESAFLYLTDHLYSHFKEKVVVLMDNSDIYVSTFFFGQVEHTPLLISYMQYSNHRLFLRNHRLKKGLLTGVYRRYVGLLQTLGSFYFYCFLGNHNFTKYFGFTQHEVKKLVEKDHTITKKVATINSLRDYYEGYLIRTKNTTIYSSWSIINYLTNDKVVQSYWRQDLYEGFLYKLNNTKKFFEIVRNTLFAEHHEIRTIVDQKKTKEFTDFIENHSHVINIETDFKKNWLYYFLCDLGLLMLGPGKPPPVTIPNKEIAVQFSHFLLKMYISRCAYNLTDVERLQDAFASIQGFNIERNYCQDVYDALRPLILNSTCITRDTDLQSFIFTSLIEKFPTKTKPTAEFYNRIYLDETILDNMPPGINDTIRSTYMALMQTSMGKGMNEYSLKRINQRTDMVMMNAHDVVVVIGSKYNNYTIESSTEIAGEVIARIYTTYHKYILKYQVFWPSMPKRFLYIGIGLDMESGNLSVAFYGPPPTSNKRYTNHVIFIDPPDLTSDDSY